MSRLINVCIACAVFANVKCESNFSDVSGVNETTVNREPKILNDGDNGDVIRDLFEKGFVRYPLAMVIDLSAESLGKVKDLWRRYEGNFPVRDLVLTTFDAAGMRRTTSTKSDSQFFLNLKQLHPSYNENASVEKIDSFTPVMEMILESLARIPFDSAILVFTGNKPKDQELGPLVEEALIRKRCRLYVVWTGEKKTNNNVVLKEISEYVGGKLVYISDLYVIADTRSYHDKPLEEGNHKKVLLKKKIGVAGFTEMDFIVNETSSKLHIKIKGRVSKAQLKTPTGELINLKTRENQPVIDYHLEPEQYKDLGLWMLEIDQGSFGELYDVYISAEIPSFEEDESTESDTEFPIVKGLSLVKDDRESEPRFRFPEGETTTKGLDIPVIPLKGNDSLSLMAMSAQQKTLTQLAVPIIVEVTSGTTLEARPGTTLSVSFDVINNVNLPITAQFSAKPDNLIITNVQPVQTLLMPNEKRIVQVSVVNTPNLQNGIGTVTLLVTGAYKTTARSAMVYFTQSSISDTWDPKVSYKYLGDCRNYDEPKTCENGQWSFEATFRDEDSGLLRVMSEPFGLIFRSEFIAGTRSPVTVTYTATCCQEKIIIWAEDLKGNYIRRSLDVFHQGLLAGEIAATVLGIILLIVLIIIIILIVVLVRGRNRNKIELPRHRAGSR